MIQRIKNIIYLLKHAKINVAWFKIVKGVMDMAISVQQHGKPMLTKIAVVDMSADKIIGDFDMVSIWAGVGDANPIERGKHLKAQNVALKELLVKCKESLNFNDNKDLFVNISIVLDTFE